MHMMWKLCPLFMSAKSQIAPMTNAWYTVPGLDGTASGQGSQGIGAVSVTHNSGYVQFNGKYYRIVTYKPQFGFGGYDLMDGLAVSDDGSDVCLFYLYCRGGRLESIWQEGYYQHLQQVDASGSCSPYRGQATSQAYFPAIRNLPPVFNPGFTINGPGISLSGGRGYVTGGDGVQRRWTTFGKVDCGTACPGGSWYEIHGLMDTAPSGACFGILYLRSSDYNSVQLGWSICMPSLHSVDAVFYASWRHGTELGDDLQEVMPGFNPGEAGLPWRPPPSMEESGNATLRQTVLV